MNYSTKLAYVSLGELLNAPLLNGKHEKGMCFGPGTRIVRMVDLYRGDTVNVNSLDRVEYPHLPANDYLLNEGDLLLNRTSLKRQGVGKAALVPNLPEPVYFDCSIIRIRPNKLKVYPRYLLYALNGPAVRPQIMRGAKTATITTISQPDISSLRIPLPPLPEQRRIAAILDKADAIRRKRQEAIPLMEEFLRSAFLDMFGDPVTNSKDWPKGQLKELCDEVIDCPHATPQYAYTETPYACLRSSDIQNGYLDWSTTKYVDAAEYAKRIGRTIPVVGDIVYCREGARFGNAARILDNKKVCLGQRMMLFRPAAGIATSEFLWAFLSCESTYHQAVRMVGGSASPHVNVGDIKRFSAVIPPLQAQQHFSKITRILDRSRQRGLESLLTFKSLFNSLVQHAFRGEL